MRTTFDLPDGLYKALKVRAGLRGVTMRELVLQLIERGLQTGTEGKLSGKRQPPPVIIPPRGTTIRALSVDEIARIEEEEDEAKHG